MLTVLVLPSDWHGEAGASQWRGLRGLQLR